MLPPFLYEELLSLYAGYKGSTVPHRNVLNSNTALLNTGSGKRCYMIATGPSLREQNLELLEGEDCFSVSNFFLHPDLNLLKPKLHFFAPWHPPLIKENFVDWLHQADSLLPKETNMVLGLQDYDLIQDNKIFVNRKVYYLNLQPNIIPGKIDLRKPVLGPQTGPLMILPVLLYMGYSEINLLGCDHTIMRDFRKNVTHFYDTSKDIRKNASDTNSWKDVISIHLASMNVFVQYQKYAEAIRKYYPSVEVFNLSPDSWLDSFPFREFPAAGR